MNQPVSNQADSQLSRALSVLNKLGRNLTANDDPKKILEQIAKDARDVLEADMVDLYEYIQSRQEFIVPPILVGNRIVEFTREGRIYADDVVYKVVQNGKPEYYKDSQRAALLIDKWNMPRPESAPENRFVFRENVASSVSLPLKAGNETVGVMFVNYRTPQAFEYEQRNLIESFANLAAISIQNSRLWEQQNQQLASLKKIINFIGAENPLETILEQAATLFSANYGSISRLTEDGQFLQYKAQWVNGKLKEKVQDEAQKRSVKEGITGHVIRTGNPFRTGNVQDVEFYSPWNPGTNSEMAIPLKSAFGGVIGVLNLESDYPNFFSDESENVGVSFASAASAAIQQSDLIENVQSLHVLTEWHNINDLLDIILKKLIRLLGANTAASVNLYDSENNNFYSYYGVGRNQEFVEKYLLIPPREHGTGRYVLETRQPLYYEDVSNVPEGMPPVRKEAWDQEIKSFAVLPLIFQNEIVGALFIHKIGEHVKFTEDARHILETYAAQTAIAIHNTRHHIEIDPLKEILTATVSENRETILHLIVKSAVRIMASDYASIWLGDKETGGLIRAAIYVKPEEEKYLNPGRDRIDASQSSINLSVYQTGNSEVINDVAAEEKAGRYIRIYQKAKSEIAVALKYQNEVIGTLNTESQNLRAFSVLDMTTFRVFADIAAGTIVNSRAYEQINHRLIKKNTSLEAVIEMGKDLTASVDLNEAQVLNLIYEKLHPLMETGNMYIALYDYATDMVRFPLTYIDGKPTEVQTRKAGSGRTEHIIETKEPLFIATREESIAWYKQTGREEYLGEPFASWMGVPMISGNRVIGVIATYHKKDNNVYDRDDLDVLQAIANQSAIALEVTHRVAELKALQGLTNDLNTELL